ncbi:MAG: ornithine cyclodeaminase family protein [Actinophytocola sp.]|nr:ornithine cyclodeaminase family protein [Actinophytocola sp.]
MLLLNNDDVASLLKVTDVVRVLEEAYEDLARDRAVCRPRIDLRLPVGDGESVYQWGTMEGGSARTGYFAIRMKSDVVREVSYAGTRTQDKYCGAPGTYCGLILLLSTRTGEPLALLNDGVLQQARVGADSAIGVRYGARSDAAVLGMLGSGGMARSHLEALRVVRDVQRVQVYSPTRAHRERYAAEVAERYGVEAVALDDPAGVYRGADVVSACTDAAGEVLRGAHIEPGTHVTAIGGRPDGEALRRIDGWLRLGDAPAPVTHPEWATRDEYVAYVGCQDDPVWARHSHGRKPRRPPEEPGTTRVVSLADVLAGRAVVRRDDAEVTFSERGNVQGAQFHAVAGLVYELALAAGRGRILPREWFLQDIRD